MDEHRKFLQCLYIDIKKENTISFFISCKNYFATGVTKIEMVYRNEYNYEGVLFVAVIIRWLTLTWVCVLVKIQVMCGKSELYRGVLQVEQLYERNVCVPESSS